MVSQQEQIDRINSIPYIKDGDTYYHLHYRKREGKGRFEKHMGFLATCPVCSKKYFIKFKDEKLGKGKKYCSPECRKNVRK